MKTYCECIGVLCCTVVLSVTLQAYGLYADIWVILDSCDVTRISLFHFWCEDCNLNSAETLDNHSSTCLPYGVETHKHFCDACHVIVTGPLIYLESFSILCNVSAVCCIVIVVCKASCSTTTVKHYYTGFAALLYFAAGVLNVAACLLVEAKVLHLPYTSLGISYYLTMTSGCYTVIQVVVLVIVLSCLHNVRRVKPPPSTEMTISAC